MVKEIGEPVKNIKALCDRLEACRNQVMQAGVHYIKALCDRLKACRNQVMQARQAGVHLCNGEVYSVFDSLSEPVSCFWPTLDFRQVRFVNKTFLKLL